MLFLQVKAIIGYMGRAREKPGISKLYSIKKCKVLPKAISETNKFHCHLIKLVSKTLCELRHYDLQII